MIRGKRLEYLGAFNENLFPDLLRVKYDDINNIFIDPSILYEDSEGNFNLDIYLDWLTAPAYISRSLPGTSFHTGDDLVKYFFYHFPKPEVFKNVMSSNVDKAVSELNFKAPYILKQDEQFKEIADALINLEEIKSLIDEPVLDIVKKYIPTTNSIIKKLIAHVTRWKEKNELIPPDVYEYNYYNVHREVSWINNPLAFFNYTYFDNGIHELVKPWYFDDDDLLKKVAVKKYIHNVLKAEAFKSLKEIIKKFKCLKKTEKQAFVDFIKQSLTSLYFVSHHHPLIEYYDTPERPFSYLTKKLKLIFKHYNFDVTYSYDEDYGPPLLSKAFIKNCFDFELKHKEQNLRLFSNNVNFAEFSYFLNGDFDNISRIEFAWDSEQVYFFIINLIEKKNVPIRFAVGYEKKLRIKNGKFSKETLQKFRSQLKYKKANPPKGSEQINLLFR